MHSNSCLAHKRWLLLEFFGIPRTWHISIDRSILHRRLYVLVSFSRPSTNLLGLPAARRPFHASSSKDRPRTAIFAVFSSSWMGSILRPSCGTRQQGFVSPFPWDPRLLKRRRFRFRPGFGPGSIGHVNRVRERIKEERRHVS